MIKTLLKTEPKISTLETVTRKDKSVATYQYMVDPTIKFTQEETARYNRIGWWPCRWVVTQVQSRK